MHKPQEFYEKIAYLFYAIADIDGKVDEAEVKKLHEEVLLIWKNTDTDPHEFGTSGGVEIEAIFEWLEEEGYKSKDAWRDFKDYASENSYLFDEATKSNIIHTCSELASIYYKVNQREEAMLEKIKSFLKLLK